jgi:hypothetical protein
LIVSFSLKYGFCKTTFMLCLNYFLVNERMFCPSIRILPSQLSLNP